MSARMRLTNAEGMVYLDRWGWDHRKVGGIYLHRMDGPDPGLDLHDHPWPFVSLVLWGGYTEERAEHRNAQNWAALAELHPFCTAGAPEVRRWGSLRVMRLDEAHRIVALRRKTCWTLVLHSRNRRRWGFFTARGWLRDTEYDETVRAERRDVVTAISADDSRRRRRERKGAVTA